MAQVNLYARAGKRWWFSPCCRCVEAFVWCIAPFIDSDDRSDRIVDGCVRFVIKHCMVMEYRAGSGRWHRCPVNDGEPSSKFISGDAD